MTCLTFFSHISNPVTLVSLSPSGILLVAVHTCSWLQSPALLYAQYAASVRKHLIKMGIRLQTRVRGSRANRRPVLTNWTQSHVSHSLQSPTPVATQCARFSSLPTSQPLFLFLDGVSLRRAHHLPGLLLCLLFGVAGIAVLSWCCWRNPSAGGVEWDSCP